MSAPQSSMAAVGQSEPATGLVQAEVCCAGISYFTVERLRDAEGEVLRDVAGNEQKFTKPHNAMMGDVVEMPRAEFDRLRALDAVQEPGSAPLPGSPGQPKRATVFSQPTLEDGDEGYVPWNAPSMGDPRPQGAGGRELGHALSAEEALALQAKAEGRDENNPHGLDADTNDAYLNYMELSKDELKGLADDNDLDVERTDGKSGEPRKEDYAVALARHDSGSSDGAGEEEAEE